MSEGNDPVDGLLQIVVDVPFWWLPVALSWRRQAVIAAVGTIVGFLIGLAVGLVAR